MKPSSWCMQPPGWETGRNWFPESSTWARGRTYLLCVWLSPGTDCPERLELLQNRLNTILCPVLQDDSAWAGWARCLCSLPTWQILGEAEGILGKQNWKRTQVPKAPSCLPADDLPPGHSDPRPERAAAASENPLACPSPGPAHRQQKGEGRQAAGTRRPCDNPTAPGTPIPGHPRGARKGRPVPPSPALPEGRAGLRGAAVPRGARDTGRAGKGPGEGAQDPPAGSRPGPPPTLRRAPSAARRGRRKRRAVPAPSGATVTDQPRPQRRRPGPARLGSSPRPCSWPWPHSAPGPGPAPGPRPCSRPRRSPVGSLRLPRQSPSGLRGGGQSARRLAGCGSSCESVMPLFVSVL